MGNPLSFAVPKEEVISTADLPKTEQQDIIDAREKALNAFERRYAEPNWLAVSSAFAKPQLGGFGAGWSSAMGELGKQEESRRELMPTIAVERAKLAQMQSMMMKNERGANLAAELLGLGPDAGRQISSSKDLKSFITPENVNNIPGAIARLETAGQSEFAKALKAGLDAYKGTIETRTGETELSAAEQERIRKDPSYVPKFSDSLPLGSRESQSRLASELKASLSGRGFDEEQLKNSSLNKLIDMNSQAMDAQAAKRMEEMNVSSEEASKAKQQILSLAEARELVAKPTLGKVLGLKSGQSAMSALLGYVQNTDEKQGAALSNALAQLKIEDQQAYDDFQVLAKLLTQNVSLTRSTMSNPSISSTLLAAQSNPTLGNTQPAILKMMDLMAHKQSETYREYKLKSKYQGDFNKLQASGDIERLHDQLLQERRELARNAADARTLPSFYSLSSNANRVSAPAAGQGAGNTSGGATTNQRAEINRILEERARQEQAQNPR